MSESTGSILAPANALMPLQVSGLTYQARGDSLINGIQLALQAGKITMVMGPNGAGKSLLLRLLHGLISPSAGQVRWNGNETTAIRTQQAMVFQRPVLLRRSVAANLDFVLKRTVAGRINPARRDAILESAGLLEKSSLPARLLSGGEQQRLAVVRALALAPRVLFLDEPTASLDPISVQLIEQLVAQASANGTKIIFVTHDIGQAKRLGDDVVFVHHGRVSEHTMANTFFKQPDSEPAQAYLDGRLVI